MGTDGNLVLYKQLWSSETAGQGQGPWNVRLMKDGELTIQDSSYGPPIWSSGSHSQNGPFKLIVSNDGNAAVYDSK